MTTDQAEHSRFVRARQRDRTGCMIGFREDLVPTLPEVGVDKVRLSVSGSWQATSGNGVGLFENALHLAGVNWFNARQLTPSGRPNRATAELSQRHNRSTIGECNVVVRSVDRNRGTIGIELSVNPTRTLAHLLARSDVPDGEQDFWGAIVDLPPVVFFERAETGTIPPSLDNGRDNWLPPSRVMRERIGRDVWERFLPIFCDQVRQFCNLLLTEFPVATANEPDNVMLTPAGRVSVAWGGVRVSTIECYFERFHSQAVAATRWGGHALLAADHSVEFWRYIPEASSFHREMDRFSIGVKLTDRTRLAIYAKRRDRLRFEVRRIGKGDYSRLSSPADGHGRMVDIMNQERANLIGAVQWGAVGKMLAGPDYPTVHDTGELIDQICAAARGEAPVIAATLKALLLEGAVSETNAPQQVIQQLLRRGVVEHVRIRRRDLNGMPKRYALTAPYRDIHISFADGHCRSNN